MSETPLRHLVLGDQLDLASAALYGFDPMRDRIWMAEVPEESTQVWSHKARIALILVACVSMPRKRWKTTGGRKRKARTSATNTPHPHGGGETVHPALTVHGPWATPADERRS